MEPADKKRMAKRILGDYPDEYATMLEFIDGFPDLQETPAQFQERCGQIALACFWGERRDDDATISYGIWQPTRVVRKNIRQPILAGSEAPDRGRR